MWGECARSSSSETIPVPTAMDRMPLAWAARTSFPPANAREIAGDKTDNDAAPGQTAQQAAHTGADLSREVRHASDVDGLGAGNHFRQHAADVGARHAGAEHHGIENIPIEHSGHRDALGRGLDVGGSPDRLYQRVAMMGPRPANERAIDVKKH
jgi:hypothetical protein